MSATASRAMCGSRCLAQLPWYSSRVRTASVSICGTAFAFQRCAHVVVSGSLPSFLCARNSSASSRVVSGILLERLLPPSTHQTR